MSPDSKRKYPRFSSPVPIALKLVNGSERVVLSRNISLGGCFFESAVGLTDESQIESLKILTDKSLKVHDPLIVQHEAKNDGHAIKWNIKSDDARHLDQHLREKCGCIGDKEKIEYLIAEQSNLRQAIQDGETSKEKRQRSIYMLIVAYLAFTILPMQLQEEHITREFLTFYSLAGLWISMGILVYLMRHLRFLGNHFRQKAMYYKALNLNRAYVFHGDYKFYQGTIFPIGVNYDKTRQRSTKNDKNRKSSRNPEADLQEPAPGEDRYFLWYPNFFIVFLQSIFVVGMYHFLSMTIRAINSDGLIVSTGLFSVKYFGIALTSFSVLALIWLQISCTNCVFYSRKVWEARRIDVNWPNPRCKSLTHTLPIVAKRYRNAGIFLAVVSVTQMLYLLPVVYNQSLWSLNLGPFPLRWLPPLTSITIFGLFFFMKILYTKDSLRNAERRNEVADNSA